jgi:methyl-branched lipid omega-hydroxylase
MGAMTPVTKLPIEEIQLSDPEFWARPDEEREEAFARLRAERPISFQSEMEFQGQPIGPGYWSLTRYEDIWTASRKPDVFISGQGVNIPDMPVELNQFLGSMIAMDAPRHSKLRGIVNRGFTPKMVGDLNELVEEKARTIIDKVSGKGKCDFVREIAAALPLEIICDMMGISSDNYDKIFELTNILLGAGDPEYATSIEEIMAAAMGLYQFAMELGEERIANPGDDITSKLVHAEVEGEVLTPQEFGSFFILLVAAGNETTRNAISHGMKLLTDHPEQREIWMNDFEAVAPTAVEEIVRYASPVIHFRRTAVVDAEIGGQPIKAGEKVVLWYNSGNRDDTKFDDPYKFDVLRSPNEHMGFGAGGPHFCLGAHLARREITVMFREIFHRLPNLQISGPPDMLQSAFIHGIKRMPCEF